MITNTTQNNQSAAQERSHRGTLDHVQ